ncbi:hypothetical protein BU17DRAFT_72095 [Hysterangium stoloniferum]|nr:hypothetical protein BU17DRAFT_72095 [Hysterangium stoloniferum]
MSTTPPFVAERVAPALYLCLTASYRSQCTSVEDVHRFAVFLRVMHCYTFDVTPFIHMANVFKKIASGEPPMSNKRGSLQGIFGGNHCSRNFTFGNPNAFQRCREREANI